MKIKSYTRWFQNIHRNRRIRPFERDPITGNKEINDNVACNKKQVFKILFQMNQPTKQ